MRKWLRHESCAEAVPGSDFLHHELEEHGPICGRYRLRVVPVDFELAVRILMVVLVGSPAESLHVTAYLGNDFVATHQGELVVAGLFLRVARVGNVRSVRVDQVELRLDTRHQHVVVAGGFLCQGQEHVARGLRDRGIVEPRIACNPGEFRLPRKLDDGRCVWHHHHVRVGRCHVQPCRKACESRAGFLHVGHGACRHELGTLHAKQVREVEEEELDPVLLGKGGEVGCHSFVSRIP